jgi:hypothetical protein
VTQQKAGPAEPPAPQPEPVSLPTDGKIDLGDGDWIKIETNLTVAQFEKLMAGFRTMRQASFEEALAAAKRVAEVETIRFTARAGGKAAAERKEELLKLATSDDHILGIWDFVKSTISLLAVDCSIKGRDGHEIKGFDETALQGWTMVKLAKVLPYVFALEDLHKAPGI